MSATENERYTSVAVALHWLIALMVIGQLAGGFFMHNVPREQAELKFQLYQLHKSFGVSVLLLTLVRLGWRLTHKPPAFPEKMQGWERFLACGAHLGFYVLLIVIPLVGWAIVSSSPFADSVQTYLFGVIHFPHMPFFEGVENRKELSHEFAEIHEYLAFAMIGLIGLHVAAALKHQVIDHDTVLGQMIPFLRKKA